jgi:hypothetical protein
MNNSTDQERSKSRWRPATNQDLEELEKHIMVIEQTLQAQITDLTAEVTNETTVEKSALTLIQSIPTLIANAIANATAAGATPTQLQAISDLQATLAANDNELAAAVVANTSTASVVTPAKSATVPPYNTVFPAPAATVPAGSVPSTVFPATAPAVLAGSVPSNTVLPASQV